MRETQPDPVTTATVWHALQITCREMRHIIDRTAQNYLIGQLRDVSAGIWTADGETVAMAEGLPSQFLGTRFAIESINETFKGNLQPGDVILTNDPYHGGHNVHLPDWGFFRPIFFEDELVFWTLARGHQMDTGGAFPGGYFPDGYDIHSEGLCIPPIKVIEGGKEREDVLDLIWNNVRWSRGVRIDNYAMIASTKRAEERTVELLERYGRDVVLACVTEMMKRTEEAIRKEIAAIPDGTYYGEAATDDDGTVLDEPVFVRVELTVKGDQLTMDFSKSDAQRKGFINCVYAVTYGIAVAGAILFFDPELSGSHNEGTMRPMEVVCPPGRVVSCEYPATVGAAPVNVGCQIIESVIMALSEALPERAVASWGKHRGEYTFAIDPRTNEPYITTSFDYDGSAGAVRGFDGRVALSETATLGVVNRGTVEEYESRIPWRILQWELVADYEGPGRWRGGPGVIWSAVNEGTAGQQATGSSDGDETLPAGAQGGLPGPPCRTYRIRGDEKLRVKPHRRIDVEPGDVVLKYSSGGGGVEPPWLRDVDAIREDVRNELVSVEAARKSYYAVIDPETLEVDLEETERLRAAARAAA